MRISRTSSTTTTTATRHPDPAVRLGAVEEISGSRFLEVLTVAVRDVDEGVRRAAITRLGGSGRADAVGAVASTATDPVARVRALAAYALGRLGGAEAIPALLRLLRDDDSQVRDRARDSLGTIGGPAAIDALLAELASATDSRARVQVAKALAKAGSQVTELARHEDPEVRAATLSGLATAADGSARWAGLVADLAGDPEADVRMRVAVVVRHLAPDDVTTVLERLAGDPDARVRETAARELSRR
ncbi:HEAT repeat domain-containing protein [Actinoplanes sp. NPDC089786]|uniref:HEAT repeat domain-containing protein n=1 Tax=Actinoplanes sp. NPDC089786 TaxID=3155185 RepID=UPI00342B4ABE